jgi:hypothetical protein
MNTPFSRRQFMHAACCTLPLPSGPLAAREQQPEIPLTRNAIEAEIRQRATSFQTQRRLVVNYYRIRRRLAYPLPVPSLSMPSVPVPSIADYPWPIWMLWELEERVHALGWAAEWFKNAEFARTASRHLEALAAWPSYCQYERPDLAAGHSGRILWTAFTRWRWVSSDLREKIRAGCLRHLQQVLPLSDKFYGQLQSKQDLLVLAQPYPKLHNIPLIGAVGAALTATAAGDPAAAVLNQRIRAVMGAILDLRAKGYTEGVGYDGYILDFVADWLSILPAQQQNEILNHPNFNHHLEESYMLAAPGALEEVAQLSDVEPREMPFHYSAQAKLARWRPDPVRAWYLPRWPAGWIRADALAALHPLIAGLRGTAPQPGALRAHYAVVLRSGWEKADLAAAMSCTTSPAGHLQLDSGTLVIGSQGRWIISDPGYQQYMADVEREFTIGPAAHNCPVINGAVQDKKQPRLELLDRVEPGVYRAKVELAACYPAKANVRSVARSLWLDGHRCVVVADQIQADRLDKLTYHWHAHPDAAVWFEQGWALLHLPDADLWLTSPQIQLSGANLRRLPGSRGQLTILAELASPPSTIWWVFALGEAPPPVRLSSAGQAIECLGRLFAL